MPNRIIKESICTSEEIDSLNDAAECFFYRLIVNCDDYGLMDARPAILKARCYPLKSVDINRIQEMLTDLELAGLISLYVVHDRPYLRVVSWEKHQQVRAKRAKFPVPADGVPITCAQLISDDYKCPRNPIQSESNPNPIQNYYVPSPQTGEADPPPEIEATGQIKNNGVPFLDIVTLYHETLPELPTCAKLTNARKGQIRQRWQEDLPDLEAWGRYFGIVKKSDFLMGRTSGTQGKPPFRADLEWLTNASNIVKVIEGKYHRG